MRAAHERNTGRADGEGERGRGGRRDNGIINHIGQLLSDALSASKVPVPAAESRRDFSGGRVGGRGGERAEFSNGRGSPSASPISREPLQI